MIPRFLNRLMQSVVTLLGVSLLVFVITHAIPADPVAAVAGPHTDTETAEHASARNSAWTIRCGNNTAGISGTSFAATLAGPFVTGERRRDAIWLVFPARWRCRWAAGDLADRRHTARRVDGEVPRQTD